MDKYVFIFFGPPGSGKGTQAEMLAEKLKLPIVSTGALFRLEIKAGSDFGKKIQSTIESGQLVKDETVNEIIAKRLRRPDIQRGVILDGYPRNIRQQEFIMKELDKLGILKNQILAILVKVSDEKVLERLSGRLSCACGATYHTKNNPPSSSNKCDQCGGELYVRDDDKPDVIRERLRVYHETAEPMIDHFRKIGNLIEVDGEQKIDRVFDDLIAALKEKERYF